MSIESLLLVAFLIVIPLLERLIRVLRARAHHSSVELPRVPGPQRPATVPRPPVPESAPDEFGAPDQADLPVTVALPTREPPPPAERHPAAERITSSERARARRRNYDSPAAPALVGSAPDARRHGASLRSIRAELRRSIVLMTILGPCKALDDDGRG